MPHAPRVCSEPGCPTIVTSGACSQHARPNANARGYNHEHRALRNRWTPRVATGQVKCWRCHELIKHNEVWDLGHIDGDTAYGGPEHIHCNRSAAGRSSQIA